MDEGIINEEERMIDEIELMKHNAEMAEHPNGAAQFLGSFFCGQYVTKEQTRDVMVFILASTKLDIESNPNENRQEKEAEILQKLLLMNMLKLQWGKTNVYEGI